MEISELLEVHWRWLTCLVLFGISLVILKRIINGMRSKSWPQASGEILESWLDESYDSEDGMLMYGARVRYAYQVAGVDYASDRIKFGREEFYTSNQAGEKRLLDSLTSQPSVPVYYHPDKPEISTLLVGVSWIAWLFYAIFILSSAGLLLLEITSRS